MTFILKKRISAILAVIVGILLNLMLIIPPWVVKGVSLPALAGITLAVGTLAVMFLMAYVGQKLIALGVEVFKDTQI